MKAKYRDKKTCDLGLSYEIDVSEWNRIIRDCGVYSFTFGGSEDHLYPSEFLVVMEAGNRRQLDKEKNQTGLLRGAGHTVQENCNENSKLQLRTLIYAASSTQNSLWRRQDKRKGGQEGNWGGLCTGRSWWRKSCLQISG